MENLCPFCGAEKEIFEWPPYSKQMVSTAYKCGTWILSQTRSIVCWSRETRILKAKLAEAETLLFDIQDIDLCPLSQTLVSKILKIREYVDQYYPNPADNPDNCLACMGAAGSAVRHTCDKNKLFISS
jgi:hypothetical protein